MKKILVLFLGILLSFPLYAQEDLSIVKSSKDDFKANTLFGSKNHKPDITLGYFLELNAGYTQVEHFNVFLPGVNLGMILNHNWSVGLSGSFLGNSGNLYFDDIYYSGSIPTYMEGAHLIGGYGGGLLEYTAFPRSVVHFSIPVMIGAGYFSYLSDSDYHNFTNDYHHNSNYNPVDYTWCFVVEPGIKAEFNIVKMMRLGIGVSYRYSPNFELVNTEKNLINQFTGRVSLMFGKF